MVGALLHLSLTSCFSLPSSLLVVVVSVSLRLHRGNLLCLLLVPRAFDGGNFDSAPGLDHSDSLLPFGGYIASLVVDVVLYTIASTLLSGAHHLDVLESGGVSLLGLDADGVPVS